MYLVITENQRNIPKNVLNHRRQASCGFRCDNSMKMSQKTTNNLIQSDTMLSFFTPQGLIYAIVLAVQGQCRIEKVWQKFHTLIKWEGLQ